MATSSQNGCLETLKFLFEELNFSRTLKQGLAEKCNCSVLLKLDIFKGPFQQSALVSASI